MNKIKEEIIEWIRINILEKIFPYCYNCGNRNILNRIKKIYCCKKCCNIAESCRYWCDLKHKCKGYRISNPYEILGDLFVELYRLQKTNGI